MNYSIIVFAMYFVHNMNNFIMFYVSRDML